MRLFDKGIVMPQPVVEKPLLPLDPGLARDKPFPIGHNLDHAFLRRKRQQRMNVIRHDQPRMNPPARTLIMHGRIPDARDHTRRHQSVTTSMLTVDGDEEDPMVNPWRDGMPQPFAVW